MTNPPGAMPPLPEPLFQIVGLGFDVYKDEEMRAYAQAYAAPLIARVAELQRQNEAQKDEWLSWDAKRAALEKDAARYRWLRAPDTDVALVLDKVVGYEPIGPGGTGGYNRYEYRAGDELDAAIDAALTPTKD